MHLSYVAFATISFLTGLYTNQRLFVACCFTKRGFFSIRNNHGFWILKKNEKNKSENHLRFKTLALWCVRSYASFRSDFLIKWNRQIISFLGANKQKAGIKSCSWTQYDFSVNRCDWCILVGNEKRIMWNCLNRGEFVEEYQSRRSNLFVRDKEL